MITAEERVAKLRRGVVGSEFLGALVQRLTAGSGRILELEGESKRVFTSDEVVDIIEAAWIEFYTKPSEA